MSHLLVPSSIPPVLDYPLQHLPEEWLQNGIGYGADLRLLAIQEHLPGYWHPHLQSGTYYYLTQPYFLHDQGSLWLLWPDSRTSLALPLPLRSGGWLTLATYRRLVDSRLVYERYWQRRTRFSGTVLNGREQIDLDDNGEIVNYNLAYADTTIDEVVLEINPQIQCYHFPLTLGSQGPGAVSVTLSPPAWTEAPIWFSHPSLAYRRVTGTPTQVGEWSISNDGTTLSLYLPARQVDPGCVYYYSLPPLTLHLSQSPLTTYGWVADPPSLDTLEILGRSTGQAFQIFALRHFPLLAQTLRVFVETDTDPEEYLVVDRLEGQGNEPVCQVYPFLGLILFGDGTNGRIPPTNRRIGVTYQTTPLLRCDTLPSQSYEAQEVNCYPLQMPSEPSFLCLDHRTLSLGSVTLSTNLPHQTGNWYGPLYCGEGYALLTCTVQSRDGIPLAGTKVQWQVDVRGALENWPPDQELHRFTDTQGRSRLVLNPPASLRQIAASIPLFSPEGSPLEPYLSINQPNDALSVSIAAPPPNDFLAQAYTFLVVDDDELQPYSMLHRTGGRLVLLCRWSEGVCLPVVPSALTENYVQYPVSLPTTTELPSLRQFLIALPRMTTVQAQVEDVFLRRSLVTAPLNILLAAPAWQMGVWTLRELRSQAGASVGTTTYLTIDRQGRLHATFNITT